MESIENARFASVFYQDNLITSIFQGFL
jgi:hypothetical protein